MEETFEKNMKNKKDYKRYVGKKNKYDEIGKIQLEILKHYGLKKNHSLLDVGCGSLRAGKYALKYLYKNKYYGIEPNSWLIDAAILNENLKNIIEKKNPVFSTNKEFKLSVFGEKFNYILANSIFIHASAEQIKKCIKEARTALKKDGVFIFNIFIGKENNKKNQWTYPGSVEYTELFIKNILKENGFEYTFFLWHYPGKQKWVMAKRGNDGKWIDC